MEILCGAGEEIELGEWNVREADVIENEKNWVAPIALITCMCMLFVVILVVIVIFCNRKLKIMKEQV